MEILIHESQPKQSLMMISRMRSIVCTFPHSFVALYSCFSLRSCYLQVQRNLDTPHLLMHMRPLIRHIQELMESIEPEVTVIEVHPLSSGMTEQRVCSNSSEEATRSSIEELGVN